MSIEQKMDALTAALEANTKALLGAKTAASKTTEKTTTTTKPKTTTTEKKEAPKKTAAQKKDDFLKAVGEGIKSQDNKKKAEAVKKSAIELAEYYGAARPSDMKPQDYEAYLEGFNQILEGEVPDVLDSNMDETEEDELDI